MQRMTRGLLLAVLAAGCFSVGTPFATQRVAQIQVGATTREQVRGEFGSPWRTGLEDGDETWTYGRYVYSLAAPARTADLKIRFDRHGVVSSYTFSTTNPGP
jgi:outer membrane protein assembly factor BamE (lipoprotein component of BamABCDE complex)